MNIDKKYLNKTTWYEDKYGSEVVQENEDAVMPPEGAVVMFTRYPFEITTHMRVFVEGKFLNAGDSYTHIGRSSQDLILAIANSGDYTLGESVILVAECCERCLNAISYKYTKGKEGYPEGSDEWKRCGTVCTFCKDIKEKEKHGDGY